MIKPDTERYRTFTRRAVVMGGMQGLLCSILAGRLYYLQISQATHYRTLADKNRISLRLLESLRGRIFSDDGMMIAENTDSYRLQLLRNDNVSVEKILGRLRHIVPMDDDDIRTIMEHMEKRVRPHPVTIRRDISWRQVSEISVRNLEFPGVLIDKERLRHYPYGADFANVLGYVGAPTRDDVQRDQTLLSMNSLYIGKNGIERTYEKSLRGLSGNAEMEVNAHGRVIRELSRKEPVDGQDLRLSIDSRLQRLGMERLGNESAALVLMDVQSGAVRAMCSTPSYDPNRLSRGIRAEEWRVLSNNTRAPLLNKAIAGVYSPGSTFKMVIALAALKYGIINADTRYFCSGKFSFGESDFHCWARSGHGSVNVVQAIARSCDVFFYETALQLGPKRIGETARLMGLGPPLGIDLIGEVGGVVPDPAWKRQYWDAPWYDGETIILGIGQGFVQATPLQLATMTARIANGGRSVLPRLLPEQPTATPAELPSLGFHRAHMESIRRGMVETVNEPYGTANESALRVGNIRMGGKTGTVQVRRISEAERLSDSVLKNEELPWELRDHALFVGFAPLKNPRWAVSVVVAHGGSGSSVAAPIARDMLEGAWQWRQDDLYPTSAIHAEPPSGILETHQEWHHG